MYLLARTYTFFRLISNTILRFGPGMARVVTNDIRDTYCIFWHNKLVSNSEAVVFDRLLHI